MNESEKQEALQALGKVFELVRRAVERGMKCDMTVTIEGFPVDSGALGDGLVVIDRTPAPEAVEPKPILMLPEVFPFPFGPETPSSNFPLAVPVAVSEKQFGQERHAKAVEEDLQELIPDAFECAVLAAYRKGFQSAHRMAAEFLPGRINAAMNERILMAYDADIEVEVTP